MTKIVFSSCAKKLDLSIFIVRGTFPHYGGELQLVGWSQCLSLCLEKSIKFLLFKCFSNSHENKFNKDNI